jgi:chromosome segregation ATPase
MKEKSIHETMLEQVTQSIDSSSRLTLALLEQLKESEADLATFRTELSIVQENVKGLLSIVYDGRDANSLVTKIALIDQKLESIDKYIANHIDVHDNTKADINVIRKDIEEVEEKITHLESQFKIYTKKIDDAEKKTKEKEANEIAAMRQSINREEEMEHERKKSIQKSKEEWNSFYVKVISTIVLAIITAVGTWFAANYINKKDTKPPEIPSKK